MERLLLKLLLVVSMVYGKLGFASVPKKKPGNGSDILGLFRRPEECMPVSELGFQIQAGCCVGCDRYPVVGAYDINGEWVEEDRHCCRIPKSDPNRPPTEKILNNPKDAEAILELEQRVANFGDKSLDINHVISVAKWHGKQVEKYAKIMEVNYCKCRMDMLVKVHQVDVFNM